MDTLDPKYLLEKVGAVFDSLICAAKPKVALQFLLKSVEDGICRCSYAHENITLLENSEFVATREDLTKIKNLLNNTDVI